MGESERRSRQTLRTPRRAGESLGDEWWVGSAPRDRPLAGVRVLDLSRVLAGPFSTMLLADLGATVVKVEPEGGDDSRRWGPPFVGGVATYYFAANRNKRSLVLDLKSEEGYEQLTALVSGAHVVVHNYTHSVARRLKVDFSAIQEINPNCVYCSVSGFGPADRERPAYDMVMQGLTGLMSVTGDRDAGPTRIGLPVVDLAAGLYTALAIAAALYQQTHQPRRGRRVEVSLYGAALSLLSNHGMSWVLGGVEPGRSGPDHSQLAPYGVFRTRDGYVTIAVGNDSQFARLCQVLGVPDVANLADFRSNADRVRHRNVLRDLIERRLRTEGARQWERRLVEADVPCGAVRSVSEAIADARGDWVADGSLDSAAPGQLLSPILLDGKRLVPYLAPPQLDDLGKDRRGRGGGSGAVVEGETPV